MFFWALLSLLLVRWVRLRDDWLLLWSGVTSAVALQNKYVVGFYLMALLSSVLAVGPRDMLRRPMLWVGMSVAVLATVPSLVWQATHGLPQLEMSRLIARENAALYGGRPGFLRQLLILAGLPVSVMMRYGLWRLLRSTELRAYRFGSAPEPPVTSA